MQSDLMAVEYTVLQIRGGGGLIRSVSIWSEHLAFNSYRLACNKCSGASCLQDVKRSVLLTTPLSFALVDLP